MADMSGEQMQAKITASRREAEGLKDKIRRRRDELADTSRTPPSIFYAVPVNCRSFPSSGSFVVSSPTDPVQSVKSRRTKPTLYHELE